MCYDGRNMGVMHLTVKVEMMMEIRVKRVYDAPSPEDGKRILVDRLWPRGLAKDAARIDVWMKDVAPSNELRKWYHQDTSQWEEFVTRYRVELAENPAAIACLGQLQDVVAAGTVTLLYSSKMVERNNATVLRDVLQQGGALANKSAMEA